MTTQRTAAPVGTKATVHVRENEEIVVPEFRLMTSRALAREWLAPDHPNRVVRPWKVDQIAPTSLMGAGM